MSAIANTTHGSAPVRVTRFGGAIRTFDEPVELWKKAHLEDRHCLVRMRLPVGARLVYPKKESHSWNNNKLRAERVRVLRLEEIEGGDSGEAVATAPHVRDFEYRVGEIATPADFSTDTTTTDAPGIHCYATRKGAAYWGERDYDSL